MWRGVLAVVVGLVAGGAATAAVEALGHKVFPPPAEILEAMQPAQDPAKPLGSEERAALLKAGIAKLPAGAFAFVLGAWFCGGLLTTLTAGLVAGSSRTTATGFASGFYWLLCLLNLWMLPGPLWFTLAGFISPWLGAWLGWFVITRFAPAQQSLRPTDAAA